jgi:hypothetical protein
MDNSHIMLLIGVLTLFSIIGISSGLVVHDNCPPHVKSLDSVKTSFIFMIISLIFVICFVVVYFYLHMLHNHNVIDVKHSTRMGHYK